MAYIDGCTYYTISGRGAVKRWTYVAPKVRLPVFGPKNVTNPFIRYNIRERYDYYLRKHYANKPFQFLIDFEKFIFKYKSKFYVKIYNYLRNNYNNRKIKTKSIKEKLTLLNNKFSVLEVEGTVEDTNCSGEDEGPDFTPKLKRKPIDRDYVYIKQIGKLFKKKFNQPKLLRCRNMILLERLKEKIFLLSLARCTRIVAADRLNKRIEFEQSFRFEPQMETKQDAHGSNACPVVQSASNTLQESQREASQGQPAKQVEKGRKRYAKLAAAEQSPDYSTLTDRYFPFKTYAWKKIQERGTKIVDLTLPLDFVLSHPNSPNCTLFSSYAYWDGDMEVKLMVNSNKFMRGQLQMAWYYGQDYERNFERRDNVYTASQQAHCLVSAAASNEGILYIPFRYYKPKMGTKIRSDDPGRLNMGRLTVRVLNQLDVPSTTYNECSFTISFRFIGSNFSGMIARDLGKLKLEAQMFRSVVRAALNVLDEIGEDPQRDNPPDIQPPRPIVPWSSHSWSVGDVYPEPTNVMRLQAPGQTPHPAEIVPQFDEMRIDFVKRVFGLFDTIDWNVNHNSGHLLFSLPGSPLFDFSYYKHQVFDGSRCYFLPPIAVLASLFGYWRGSIDLRIDAIATFAHTGRLLIASVPRITETPTLDQAKSCPNVVFDLQGESRQFYFNVPYIADRPWWHTKGYGNNVLPPTYIHCFVLNELIPMDSVSKNVELNLYVRGGRDFEVSIPVVPRIGLSTYNAKVFVSSQRSMYTKDGYSPIYVGSWHRQSNGRVNIIRYGDVSDHVTQFVNMKLNTVYGPDNVRNGRPIRGVGDNTEWYIVASRVDSANGFGYYGLYFEDLHQATVYIAGESIGERFTKESGWFDYEDKKVVSGRIYFREIPAPLPDITKLRERPRDIEFVMLEPQMDERLNVDSTCEDSMLPLIPSTQSGHFTFGETFDNLKTLCRRYQLYLHYDRAIPVDSSQKQVVKLPLLVQGIPFEDQYLKNNPAINASREGPIPIIASGYRFSRGGMRLRIVWRSGWHCTMRVEVRPDERLASVDTTVAVGHKSFYNDGYAFMLQNTDINNILEFEVPFYQAGILSFLQNPVLANNLESYHFSLGNLYIAFACSDSNKVNRRALFDVYYSLADDCRFSVFQGFPPMIAAPDHEIEIEPQMGVFGDIKKTITNASTTIKKIDHLADKVDVIIPGPLQPDNAIPATESTSENAATNPVNAVLEKEGFLEWITKTVPSQCKAVILNGVSQLMHCIINPTIKTICWALASFLVTLGLLCSSMITKFCTIMHSVIKWLQSKGQRPGQASPPTSQTNPPSDAKLVPDMNDSNLQSSMPEDVQAGLVGTVVASIAAGMSASTRMPRNIPDFTKGVWDNIGKFTFSANHLTTFFKNNLTWIMKAYKWVVKKIFPKKSFAVELKDMGEEIHEFAKEVTVLLDESNAQKIEVHPKWNLRVYACAAKATILLHKMTISADKTMPRTPALLGCIRAIIKKRDELTKNLLSPPIRFEPFVIGLSGPCNIGKSHICQEIGKDLLKTINYKTYDELIYTRTPGNAYWNQLRSQPICLYDDFAAIDGELGTMQAAELFCLKSRAVFNPPQAAIEDKHIRYNPIMVFLASNATFPKISTVACNEAFWRRRDMLIAVERNVSFYAEHNMQLDDSPRRFKKDLIKNYEHLKFRICRNVSNEKDPGISETMTYIELKHKLQEVFRVYYLTEMEKYMEAAKSAFDFFPDDEISSESVEDVVKQYSERLEDINKFRFGDLNQFKQFLLAAVVDVDHTSGKQVPALLQGIYQLSKCDPITARTIADKDPVIAKLYNSYVIRMSHNVEANMMECTDSEPLSSKEKKESPAYIEVDLDKYMDMATKNCVHYQFDPEMEFERPKEFKSGDKEISVGYFFDAFIGKGPKIPDEPCTEDCKWNIDVKYEEDMLAWYNLKNAPNRRAYMKELMYNHMPQFFVKKMIKTSVKVDDVDATIPQARWAHVKREVKSWLKWAEEALCTVGDKIYSFLCWALKAVAFLGAIFAITGFVHHKINPHEKACKEMQYAVDNNIPYIAAYQNTVGGLDGAAQVHAEIMTNSHFTQELLPSSNESEGNMQASGDFKTYGKPNPQTIRDVAIKLVGQLAKEQEISIIRLIKRNTIFLQAIYGSTTLSGRLMGIMDHYAISVDHYDDKFSRLPEEAQVFLVGRGFKVKIKYTDLEYKKFQDSSLGYYKLPRQIPPFKNLLKHVARQKDHRHVGPNSFLVEPLFEEDSAIITQLYCERVEGVTIEATNGFNAFTVADGYKYPRGGRGMCGSVLVSSHLEHPIYGIHVAGDVGGRLGISEAITFEQFQHLLSEINIIEVNEPQMYEDVSGFIKPQTDVQLLGVVPKNFRHRTPGVSKVIPTLCHGEIFPVYCDKPVLTEKDERIKQKPFNPLQEGINKHGILTENFPSDLINLAADDLRRRVLAKVKPVRGKVGKLSKSICIVGDPNVEGFDKLDFNTSEGFPYSTLRPKNAKSKSWMLDLDQNEQGLYVYKGCDEILTSIMKIKKNQRLRRELPFTVFTDCLKDRKIPLPKITKPGSVRIFSISPLDYTIQSRQMFMDFSVSYQNARLDAEHAVGIDVNSFEWTDLAQRLINKGNKIVALDYSNFGPSLNALCAYKAIEIIRDWYKFNGDISEDNDVTREMMGYELIHSVHLSESVCYRTLSGLPSGGPLTVIQNSLVNSLYLRIAWLLTIANNSIIREIEQNQLSDVQSDPEVYRKVNGTLESFHDNVTFFVYGDDVIISVSNNACEIYNASTIAECFHQYGIVIKNATKKDEIVRYQSLLDPETTFLKNQFIKHPKRSCLFLAGLEIASIEDTLNWTYKEWQFKLKEISLEASDAAIRNAYGRGLEYFDSVRNKVFDYWLRRGEILYTPSWDEIDNRNFGKN